MLLRSKIPDTLTSAPVGITLTGTTDAQGHFSIRAQNGSYTLTPALAAYLFAPGQVDVSVAGKDIDGQDFFGLDGAQRYLDGQVFGIAGPGVGVAISGPVSASVAADSDGIYVFGPLPAGTYTVTANGAAGSSYPAVTQVSLDAAGRGIAQANFLVAPSSAPAHIVVSGDAASGISGGTFVSLVPFQPTPNDPPSPSVLIYDSRINEWRFKATYDPSGNDGALGGDMGGEVAFPGLPAAGTYGPSQQAPQSPERFNDCWRSGAANSVSWVPGNYTLTITTVGPGQPAAPPDGPAAGLTYYAAHGSLHIDCTGPLPGAVSVDTAF
ncbi:MAG TPA: carboxypeptidase-like regulatory domain-containing protein [Myxococcales bacterium]|jgi:hypothetical protein